MEAKVSARGAQHPPSPPPVASTSAPATQQQQEAQLQAQGESAKWDAIRAAWLQPAGRPKPEANVGAAAHNKRRHVSTVNVTHEMVLSFNPFPQPVPLSDVVETLVDLWEQEEYD
ncbi:hypothetical protein FOA52_002790 [Chlamydomonas sp. UWO 241]|nr:hypothetical protein FOA52_002790 [Chlamydomonas sp. UWO 241]